MTSITTKELRENMAQVVRRLRRGEVVQLTYRHEVIGTLQPAAHAPVPLHRGSPEAILGFLETVDFGAVTDDMRDPGRDVKQQIAELRDRDL